MAKMTVFAVVASRMKVTVWPSGSGRARAMIWGPSVSGQACAGAGLAVPGALAEVGEHEVGAVDLVAGGAEVLPDRAEAGAAGDAVLHEPGGLGLVGVVAGTGVDAQLGFQCRADRAGCGRSGPGRWAKTGVAGGRRARWPAAGR